MLNISLEKIMPNAVIFCLILLFIILQGCARHPSHLTPDRKPITDVSQGEPLVYENNVGDTWDPAWADDDNLYSPSNDGTGWYEGANSNIAFSMISGNDFMKLDGKTVNPLSETGTWGGDGPDGRTWKSSGCISVDGTLYFVVSRHMYGDIGKDPFRRQTAINTSIIN